MARRVWKKRHKGTELLWMLFFRDDIISAAQKPPHAQVEWPRGQAWVMTGHPHGLHRPREEKAGTRPGEKPHLIPLPGSTRPQKQNWTAFTIITGDLKDNCHTRETRVWPGLWGKQYFHLPIARTSKWLEVQIFQSFQFTLIPSYMSSCISFLQIPLGIRGQRSELKSH